MKVACRLPNLDEHIPTDNQIPNGLGLPVLVHYEGEPVGEVVKWEDQGDGTALAEVDLDVPGLDSAEGLTFGLDARARFHREEDGRQVLESFSVLKSVGVWPTGARGFPSLYGDDVP